VFLGVSLPKQGRAFGSRFFYVFTKKELQQNLNHLRKIKNRE